MHSLRLQNCSQSFRSGVRILDGISFALKPGEMVALVGSSGSGKSTLLRVIAGLLRPETGTIEHPAGAPGFVFQGFNLVDRLPVLTNVLCGALPDLPLWRALSGFFTRRHTDQALEALRRVGMEQFVWQRASQLSGGQKQRVALARALMQKSSLLLADEPVASLDPESARKVMDIIADLNKTDGLSVLISLHQPEFVRAYCSRVIGLKEGKIVFDGAPRDFNDEILNKIYGHKQPEAMEKAA